MTAYRLFPATNGPAAPVTFSGNIICGVVFCVTAEAWFTGYWWWVCNSGQSAGPYKFALWQVNTTNSTQTLIPGSVVTSGTLTAGQWNYVPLAAPVPLSAGGSAGAVPKSQVPVVDGTAEYIAAVGINGNFPDTNHWWGSGNTAAAGITSGPLTAYSAPSGTLPAPYPSTGMAQGVFTTAGSDPSVNCPQSPTGSDDNIWLDVQLADYAGSGVPVTSTALRLWPNYPKVSVGPNNDTTLSMTGTAFTLSRPCKLNKILQFNPAGSTGFPTRTGIWNSDTQAIVAATDNSSPAWKNSSGAAAATGDGWVYADYSGAGITLPAGNYIASFYNGSGVKCYTDVVNYFFTGADPVGGAAVGGPGWNGLSWGGGILTAPNVANGPMLVYDDSSGTKPGQSAYKPNTGAWAYPGEFEASADWGESRMVDVEVVPAAAALVPPLTSQRSGLY